MFSPLAAHRRRRPRRLPRNRLGIERLESRQLLATLGLGIVVRDGVTNEPTETIEVGDQFWVDVVLEDQRSADPQGVIALPLDLSWDADEIELLSPDPATFDQFSPELLTDGFLTPLPGEPPPGAFPLQRFVDALDVAAGHTGYDESTAPPTPIPAEPTMDALRGASLPAVGSGIALGVEDDAGDYQGVFARLQFRALRAVTNTPFTMVVAGSMSFADADPLDGVNTLSAQRLQDRQPPNTRAPEVNAQALAVTEFLTIAAAPVPMGALSGHVYLDKNANGQYDIGEQGLPNVTVVLSGVDDTGASVGRVVTTGADGLYAFLDLAPGSYRIAEVQPNPVFFIDGAESLGQIVAQPGVDVVGDAGVIDGNDAFEDIVLGRGEQGVEYHFGELYRPNKRMFLASADPYREVCDAVGLNCATVHGSGGDDQITVSPRDQVTIQSPGEAPQVVDISSYDAVLIDARAGSDVVTLEATPGDELICVAPSHASLRRGDSFGGAVNYGVTTKNAETARVLGGGGVDIALFKDSAGDDHIAAGDGTVAGADVVEFASSGPLTNTRVEDLDSLTAVSTRGGNDTAANMPPISFELLLLGDFIL